MSGGLFIWRLWNNNAMQAVQVEHYIRRATDFLRGMHLMRGDESYLNSSALLAIHSAVSYSDALRTGLGETKLSADDHTATVDTLRQVLLSKRYKDDSGLKFLRELLSKKNLVAYGNKGFSDYQTLINRAEQFAKWSNKVGSQLKIEGWRDANE